MKKLINKLHNDDCAYCEAVQANRVGFLCPHHQKISDIIEDLEDKYLARLKLPFKNSNYLIK